MIQTVGGQHAVSEKVEKSPFREIHHLRELCRRRTQPVIFGERLDVFSPRNDEHSALVHCHRRHRPYSPERSMRIAEKLMICHNRHRHGAGLPCGLSCC
jgi:hypothetical protein